MVVFVLMGGWDYEGESLLGVFESQAEAEAAQFRVKTEYDYFEVRRCPVGALVGL